MSLLMNQLSISPDLSVIGCFGADGLEMEGTDRKVVKAGLRDVDERCGWLIEIKLFFSPPPPHTWKDSGITFFFGPQGRLTKTCLQWNTVNP